MGIQYLSNGRSYVHQKTTKKRAIYTVAHTYKYTELTVPHKLRLSRLAHVDISPVRPERQMPQKLPLATQLLFSYLPLRILSLFSHCILPCNHFHPLSRPLYWYFSAFSRSPLSPIAATVGFELSHFSSLHFLLSAAIICTWRMPFLIIIPDKRSRSPSSAKRMCI